MYNQNKYHRTSLKVNTSVQGETIEEKIERIVNNNEPITEGAGLIYQTRDEGVKPEHDPRTDRFEIAADLADRGAKNKILSRQTGQQPKEKEVGKTEPTHGQAGQESGQTT